MESCRFGIKLNYLISWAKILNISDSLTTKQVCEKFIRPTTQQAKLSYCELLMKSKDTKKFVGLNPCVFISHAWDDRFLDVLRALIYYFRTEADVVIWFDVFSCNQHKSFGSKWWCDTIKSVIHSIGHTVMVLTSWKNPIPLQRAWCIWEFYCSMEKNCLNGKCKFDVAMSPSSVGEFIRDLNEDSRSLFERMKGRIDISKSHCFKEEAGEIIHTEIKRSVGFDELNKEILTIVIDQARCNFEASYRWFKIVNQKDGKPCDLLPSMNKSPVLFSSHSQGEHEKALPLFEECLAERRAMLGDRHPDTLPSLSCLVVLCSSHSQGEHEQALPLSEECLAERRAMLYDRFEHENFRTTGNNISPQPAVIYIPFVFGEVNSLNK